MFSTFSLGFIDELFPHILRIFVPSFFMQLLINAPASYFRMMDNFTGSIELIFGIIWSLLYTMEVQNETLNTRQILVTMCVIIWSLRLGGFLLYRMLILGPLDTRIDKMAQKYGRIAIIAFWLCLHGIWPVICCLPAVLIHSFPMTNIEFTVFDFLGLSLWLCGFFMESFADQSKLKSKISKKKRYYHLGKLWNYCRNPNHCGEIFCWLGLTIVALNIFFHHHKHQFNVCILILSTMSFLFSLLIMIFEASLISEIKNNKRFGNQLEYHQYRQQTSVLWPIPPRLYVHLPTVIRQTIFFDWNMYDEGLEKKV